MTRKEQIAKKAARAAALATYKAILNPPVWKVAGTSFTTTPTWQDIAKAAAAASYGAVLKMAQESPEMPKVPDMGKAPEPWGKVPDPSKDPIFGKDVGKADDLGNVVMEAQPVNWHNVANALQAKARPLYDWIVGGAAGALSEPAKVAAQEFAKWVKAPIPGKMNWAKAERWPEIAAAISSNAANPALKMFLLSL